MAKQRTAKPRPSKGRAAKAARRPPEIVDKDYRRRQITEAALELFAQRSFAAVTIKDIAGKLRINSALIYYYFESKEDLFRASIESAIFDAVAQYDKIRSSHDHPVNLINAWLESNIKLSRIISNLVKVMLDHTSLSRPLPSVERLIKRFYDEEYRILSSAIARGIELGIFRKVDPHHTALFVSTHLDGLMVANMIRPDFDLGGATTDLREILFRELDYDSKQSRGGPRAA